MIRFSTTLPLVAGAIMMLAVQSGAAAQNNDTGGEVDWEKQPYIIKDGKVDYGTYNGFRRYHSYCHVCHGPDALGSSYAPALKTSMDSLSYEQFLEVVVNGRQGQAGNPNSVMPPFAEVPDVMLYIDHIYAYLKARADDKIGRGRPDRIDPDQDPVFQEWKASQ